MHFHFCIYLNRFFPCNVFLFQMKHYKIGGSWKISVRAVSFKRRKSLKSYKGGDGTKWVNKRILFTTKTCSQKFLHFVILSLNGCKTQPSFNFSNIVNSCNFLQIWDNSHSTSISQKDKNKCLKETVLSQIIIIH